MKRLPLTRIARDAKISPMRLQMTFSIPLCSCGTTAHTAKAVSLLPVYRLLRYLRVQRSVFVRLGKQQFDFRVGNIFLFRF